MNRVLRSVLSEASGRPSLPRGLKYKDAVDLYRTMVRMRRVEDEALGRQREGALGLYVSGRGREALLAGIGFALPRDDLVFSSHRDHGLALCRGVSVEDLFAHWRGAARSAVRGRTPPVPISSRAAGLIGPSGSASARMAQAPGTAHAIELAGGGAAVCVLAGAGALDTPEAHIGFVAARELSARVLFVLTVPPGEAVGVGERLGGRGLDPVLVDGDDALAVASQVMEARGGLDSGASPRAVVAETAASGPVHDRHRDPLCRLRRFLIERRALDEEEDRELQASVENEIRSAWEMSEREAIAAPDQTLPFEGDAYASEAARLRERAALLEVRRDRNGSGAR